MGLGRSNVLADAYFHSQVFPCLPACMSCHATYMIGPDSRAKAFLCVFTVGTAITLVNLHAEGAGSTSVPWDDPSVQDMWLH